MLFDNNRCYSCHPSCLTCTSASAPFCATCDTGLYRTAWIWNSNTVLTCQAKTNDTYIDGSSIQRYCHQNCSTCLTASTCLTCKPGFYKIDGSDTCIKCSLDTESTGYFFDSSTLTCKPCDANCSRCIESSVICTACPALHEVSRLNRTCVPTAVSSGFFFDSTHSTNLLPCDPNCKTCSVNGPAFCLSCYPGLHLMPNRTCVSACPVGFATDAVTGDCLRCVWPCKTCDLLPNNCTTCTESLLLGKDLGPTWDCTFTGSGFFTNPSGGSMTACSSNCTGRCDYLNDSMCLVCSHNFSATI